MHSGERRDGRVGPFKCTKRDLFAREKTTKKATGLASCEELSLRRVKRRFVNSTLVPFSQNNSSPPFLGFGQAV